MLVVIRVNMGSLHRCLRVTWNGSRRSPAIEQALQQAPSYSFWRLERQKIYGRKCAKMDDFHVEASHHPLHQLDCDIKYWPSTQACAKNVGGVSLETRCRTRSRIFSLAVGFVRIVHLIDFAHRAIDHISVGREIHLLQSPCASVQPVLRNPAAIPLIVTWMARLIFSRSDWSSEPRFRASSSTCRYESVSR
jgi:hypothetical protein